MARGSAHLVSRIKAGSKQPPVFEESFDAAARAVVEGRDSASLSDDGDGGLAPIELDLERIRGLASLAKHAAPFRVRGPTYLKDKKKIPAGDTMFALAAMDVIEDDHVLDSP
eukprot:gene12256-15402_t